MTVEDAELVWAIDHHGRLSVEKIDETGSSKIWLGPTAEVLATLADFLNRAKIAPDGAPPL